MLGFLAVGGRCFFFVILFSQSPILTGYAKTVVCWMFAVSVKWCLSEKNSYSIYSDSSQKFSVLMMLIDFIFYYSIIRFYIKNMWYLYQLVLKNILPLILAIFTVKSTIQINLDWTEVHPTYFSTYLSVFHLTCITTQKQLWWSGPWYSSLYEVFWGIQRMHLSSLISNGNTQNFLL